MNSFTPIIEPGPETILVIDDHAELCEIAALFLGRCGYLVIMANNGEQAKKIAHENTNIDLLLTDVEMPGMTGNELAQWFRAARPHAAVVFMSGNKMPRERLEPCHFVEKPFIRLDTLLNTIREALHQRRAVYQTTSIAA